MLERFLVHISDAVLYQQGNPLLHMMEVMPEEDNEEQTILIKVPMPKPADKVQNVYDCSTDHGKDLLWPARQAFQDIASGILNLQFAPPPP